MKKPSTRLLCVLLALINLRCFAGVGAAEAGKAVRVGWYESSYNMMDQSGRRTGYAYEYQLKLSAYTGWSYEYVHGSWAELMQMLIRGDIDMMSDVSYTPERAELMFFPDLAMGTEEYYVFIAPGKEGITPGVASSLNGKKIGANKSSIQVDFFRDWARANGIQAELVEVVCSEDESLQMMESGELDAYVTVDSFVDPSRAVPVYKIGSSDFYFAVSKTRPDLLADLNMGMSRIHEENRYYNQQLYERFIRRSGANAFLTNNEVNWLSQHGAIRVGYQDNYLAFCARDQETGELTGAIKDYLEYASTCIANVQLNFEAVCYPTASAAMEALRRGEVDCVFPANLSGYDGEQLGAVISPPVVNSEVYAVVRLSDQSIFRKRDHVIVAVNQGNPNYDAFLAEHFPGWRKVYYANTDECLKAVAEGVADCVLVSNYRYNNIARQCERYRLTNLSTGVGMDYCFAIRKGQTELFSILTKTVELVPDSAINSALTYYITEDSKLSFTDVIVDNLSTVMSIVFVVVLVILFLLIQNMRAVRKAKKLISATETDEMTGLYNRGFFFQYVSRMFREHPDTAMDAIVVDIEQFHSINALNGRDFGDQVLRALGGEIHAVSKEIGGIAGRFEADRFDIYCRHLEDYAPIFERLQKKLDELAPNANIQLRMGVMAWQGKTEPVQQFDMASTACSMARGHYKEHLIVFNEKIRQREIYEQRLVNDLKRALNGYEFEVYYQPKYDIQVNPPKLVSAEALVRWRHPELGMIAPDEFIPLFERNGKISEVDKYVWGEAARQVMRWREQYGVTIPVSVNLSRVDVFDPTLEQTLDKILILNGLNHSDLKLEVTESAYTENAEQVIQVVEGLRRKGYMVEMDDFGTGYSSLNMLSAMPIDVLKMDKAFIQNIEHDEKDAQLVSLIINIAKSLKIPVVAEGVETETQMQLLKKLGCAIVQGYYFSRPLHAADFENLFIRNTQPLSE